VVVLVRMADTTSSDAPALSSTPLPHAARRWMVVGSAVLIPVIIGALASVVLYATRRVPPVVAATTPVPAVDVPAASDTMIADGKLLVIQPATTDRVEIPLGQVVEIVLQSGPGQKVVSNTTEILTPVTPNPPCQIVTLCDQPGAATWTFDAVRAGVAYLTISFGRHCSATTGACDSMHIVLLKPFTVDPRQ
jgi:hypothetical protein